MSQFIIDPYTPFPSAVGAVGGWVELGRTTLGSSGDVIDLTSLDNKRYYMFLFNRFATGGNTDQSITLNGDTGSNYARRSSVNGGSDATATSASAIQAWNTKTTQHFYMGYIANLSTKEKLLQSWNCEQSTAGAATAPDRVEFVGKWANTSNSIDQITFTNGSAGSFDTGSEVVMLGWDPADTHTTNFWEELASVDLSGGAASSLSTGTFTAKKYLWIQYYVDSTTSVANIEMQVGNGTVDSGSNYSRRANENGGTDGTATSDSKINQIVSGGTTPIFANMFMINNASNEKLEICHSVEVQAAGAATAPDREEDVGKWTNTSSQVNIIEISSTAGNMGTNTIMKVWGSD